MVSGDKQLYRGRALSPLEIKFRDGMEFPRRRSKLLWEEIAEIRAKAKPAATRPAATRPAKTKATPPDKATASKR